MVTTSSSSSSSSSSALSGDPLAAGYQGILQGAAALKDKTLEGVKAFVTDADQAATARDERKVRLDQERSSLAPPVPEKPATTPDYHPTNPVKAWGSSAMMFAMIASALTRQPMNNALNAAASALKAFKEKDDQTYQREYQKWQMETQNAVRMFEYQQKAYQQSLAELDRREGMSERVYSDSVREATARARALATSFQDDKAIYVLDHYGLDGLRGLERDRDNLKERTAEHAGQVEKEHAVQSAVRQVQASPEYAAASDTGKLAMIAQAVAAVDPKYSVIPETAKARLEVQMSNDLKTKGIGKAEQEVLKFKPLIEEAQRELRTNGELNAQTAGLVVDATQRLLNNQAVRMGLVRLQLEHQPAIDRAAAIMNSFNPNANTALAGHQAGILLDILDKFTANVDKLHADEVRQAREHAQAMGLDPNQVAPDPGGSATARSTGTQGVPPALTSPQSAAAALTRALGGPVTITSDHRSAAHNAAVGGAPGSEHVSGTAYDFKVEGKTPEAAALTLAAQMLRHGYQFDQILIQPGDTHVGWGSKSRGAIAFEPRPGQVGRSLTANDVRNAAARGDISRDDALVLLQKKFGMN